jgi:hypothetical protein
MAEEAKVVPEVVTQTQEAKPVLTEIEQRASSQGWVPQDEWDGDPDQWRPAKEFIDRGELFKKIEDQNRTIKEFKRTLEEFGQHHAKVRDVEFQRALNMLRAQKKDALELGEAGKVVDIDERIDAVKNAQYAARVTPVVNLPDIPEDNPVFNNWVDRNGWYHNNKAMRAYADRIGNELGSRGNISATDLLTQVEQEVKKEFAHKFENPNRQRASSVEGSTNRGSSGRGDKIELTADERRVAERFIKTIPGYTMEKYKEELKKVR